MAASGIVPRMQRAAWPIVLALALAGCGDPAGPSGGGAPFVSVTTGDGFSCALRSDGRAYCWGQALFGQIGDSATTLRTRAVPVAGNVRFRSLAAGADHVCGVAQDSTAWCWGLNDFLELGSVTPFCNQGFRFVNCADMPTAVEGGLKFDSVTVGGYATCGLVRSTAAGGSGTHAAWCWGWNTHGEMGLGQIGEVTGAPAAVDGGKRFTSISLDLYHACGLDALGSVYCWGSNVHGQLGADTTRTPRCNAGPAFNLFCAPEPILSSIGQLTTSVSTGGNHTCALDNGGLAWCWGSAEEGVLGSATAPGGATPVAVAGGRSYASLSAGDSHNCALTGAGEAWCWGINDVGQLGGAAATDLCSAFGSARPCNRTPVRVTGLPELSRVSVGYGHACAVSTAGEVWCWGRGTEGQLGDGLQANSSVAVRVEIAGS